MLDPILLQSFLAVAQTRNFTEAGRRLGLQQSTVSQHVRKLEAAAGRRLFLRDTHRVVPTADGEAMVGFARSILEANERARQYFSGARLRGRVRFGTSEDFVSSRLPEILRDFTRRHPGVDLELTVDLSATLNAQFDAGELDLVLAKRRTGEARGKLVWRDRLVWIGGPGLAVDPQAPLPLILYAPPSLTRTRGAGGAGARRAGLARGVHQRQPERPARRGAGGPRHHAARAQPDAGGAGRGAGGACGCRTPARWSSW